MKILNQKILKGILLTGILFVALITATMFIKTKKNLTIKVDGEELAIATYTEHVQGVLHENNIEIQEKDKIEPSLDTVIEDGDTITIKRAVNVKLITDGEEKEIKTAENTIEDLIKEENLDVEDHDIVEPSKDSLIEDGMEIKLIDVEVETITEKEILAYETITQEDSNLEQGTVQVKSEGANGEKEVTYEVYYHDGKLVDKKKVSESVNIEPQNKVQVKGIKEKPKTVLLSRGDSNLAYSKVLTVKTTAYSPKTDYGAAITASGKQAVRDINGYSTVAVDPRVIPLGTKLYIEGYGLAIAADTGGAIKGNKIDLFFNTYNEACNWGVKTNKVYILK